jgi:hypothetical protein
MMQVAAGDRNSLLLHFNRTISTVVFAGLVVVCTAVDAAATTPGPDGLMFANHVRFACAFTDQTSGPKIQEREFCDIALSALTGLGVGHLDSKVAKETAWSVISEPEAALEECRKALPPPPTTPAGEGCERSSYELVRPERPLVVISESLLDAISLNDIRAIAVVIRGVRLSNKTIDISFTTVEPSNHFVSEQRVRDYTVNFSPVGAIKPGVLHEELQFLLARYFHLEIVNEIKIHDIQLNGP